MFKTSIKWMPLLAALLLAGPLAASESAALELAKVSRVHWIFSLVEKAKKADSDEMRRDIVRILMSKAQEMDSSAEELQDVKRRLLEQSRVEGDSQLMRDVIMALNILIQTKRAESGLPPPEGPRKLNHA